MFKGEKIKIMKRKGPFFKEFVWNRILLQLYTNQIGVWVLQEDPKGSVPSLGKLDEKVFLAEMKGKPVMVG